MVMSQIIPTPLINQVVTIVDSVTRQIVSNFREGILQGEDRITGALVHALERGLNDSRIEGIEIKVKTFSLKEERETKADLGVLLNVEKPQYRLSKAFIAQAKICECKRGFIFSYGNIRNSLIDQCLGMMKITSSSFVIVYTKSYDCGIVAFPAADVYALDNIISCRRLSYLHKMRLKSLFESFLKCYIGDFKIAHIYWGISGLKAFTSEYSVKHSLLLQLLSGWEERVLERPKR